MKLRNILLAFTVAAFAGLGAMGAAAHLGAIGAAAHPGAMGAAAHSEQEATTPADGATLSEKSEMIHMVFDDPMRVTMVRLLDADGAETPLERGTGLDPSLELHTELELHAEPEPIGPGAYPVEWRGLSSDGHAMSGPLPFEIEN